MNKITLPNSVILSLIGVILVTFSASAGASILEGVVKDPTGRSVKGADVRIEARNFSKVVKTDTSGHYVSGGLAVGSYRVTVLINGEVKASVLDARTQLGRPTQLNFDLTGKTASAKKHTYMVYVRPDVDTRIGSGRWVEMDDNGNVVNESSNTGASSNITRITGPAVQQTQIRPGIPIGR
jgi:hypothetical protein